jgi:hypothetical protein
VILMNERRNELHTRFKWWKKVSKYTTFDE